MDKNELLDVIDIVSRSKHCGGIVKVFTRLLVNAMKCSPSDVNTVRVRMSFDEIADGTISKRSVSSAIKALVLGKAISCHGKGSYYINLPKAREFFS